MTEKAYAPISEWIDDATTPTLEREFYLRTISGEISLGRDGKDGVDGEVTFDYANANYARVKEFNEVYGLTNEPVYVYVNSATGNDEQGDGSPGSPYKTMAKVEATMPKLINQTRVIRGNGTFDEDVTFKGIIGGGIWFQPTGGVPSNGDTSSVFKIRGLNIQDSVTRALVNGVEFINPGGLGADYGSHLRAARGVYLSVLACRFAEDSKIAAKKSIDFDGAMGTLSNSYFNSQHNIATIQNGASVKIYGTNTHGATKSTLGLWVAGTQAYKVGEQTWIENGCNTPYLVEQGGVINASSWQNYTPVISGYGDMVLSSIVIDKAKYDVKGKTCNFLVRATFSVDATPTNIIEITLPVPAKDGLNVPLGASGVRDPAFGLGFNLQSGVNKVWCYKIDSSNWTIGTNRQVQIQGTYEVA